MKHHSDFWIDPSDNIEELRKSDQMKFLMKLSSFKNSIMNFVNILTKRSDISVKFGTDGKSFATKNQITINADMTDGNIDSVVGLALHESCHILKTDFDYFKTFWNKIPRDVSEEAKSKNYNMSELSDLSTDILNYIEDRYIDDWAYNSYPGYRGYYDKLYEKYWNSEMVTNGLKSCFFRTRNIDSYKFRVINLSNENSDLSALPGLKEIHDLIDFKNISRLKNQLDRGELAKDVVKIIVSNLGENLTMDFLEQMENEEEKKDGGGNDQQPQEKMEESVEPVGGSNKSDSEKNDVENILKEQLDFINGRSEKNLLTQEETELLENIERSATTFHISGGSDGIPRIPCIVIKNVNSEIIESGLIPIAAQGIAKPSEDAVMRGMEKGLLLGKKLQIRGEKRLTRFTRYNRGRIDKRLLSSLGYGESNVFYHELEDKFKSAHIHISIDASSSMGGEKWDSVIESATAICKACSMIHNVEVTLSFRATIANTSKKVLPLVVFLYDSKVDKISKLRNLLPCFYPCGSTPEGLCFEPIFKKIPISDPNLESFLLTFSDGGSNFVFNKFHYKDKKAAIHIKRQIDGLIGSGCEVLAYYVGENDKVCDLFKFSYGKNAKNIDVTDVASIAKTMNEKLLSKLD